MAFTFHYTNICKVIFSTRREHSFEFYSFSEHYFLKQFNSPTSNCSMVWKYFTWGQSKPEDEDKYPIKCKAKK